MRYRLANRLCTCLGKPRVSIPQTSESSSFTKWQAIMSATKNALERRRTPSNAFTPCNMVFCIRHAMSAKVDADTLNIHISNASPANTATNALGNYSFTYVSPRCEPEITFFQERLHVSSASWLLEIYSVRTFRALIKFNLVMFFGRLVPLWHHFVLTALALEGKLDTEPRSSKGKLVHSWLIKQQLCDAPSL